MNVGDTIVAPATPPGRSVRAIVRVSGPAAGRICGGLRAGRPWITPSAGPSARLGRGVVRLLAAGGELPVLLMWFEGPRSYTGEDVLEILLPGNPLLVERVVAWLASFESVRPAGPGEFTARAYLNGRITLDQAEGVAASIAAVGESQLRAAAELMSGRAGRAYRSLADEVATLLALVEAGIDFADSEDVSPIAPSELRARLGAVRGVIERELGSSAGSERRAGLPRVVIAGAPNAGKSTLLNALLGRRRAVESPIAGTTRDVLAEELDLSDALPGAGRVLVMDCAGVEGGDAAADETLAMSEVDADARAASMDAVRLADVLVWCDPTGAFAAMPAGAAAHAVRVIRVRTKADQPSVAPSGDGVVGVCALDGWNMATLRRLIAEAAVGAGAADELAVLPRHRRALAAALGEIGDAIAAAEAGGRWLRDAELVAGSLRAALDRLGEISGRMSPDDVLGRVFAAFCIGK